MPMRRAPDPVRTIQKAPRTARPTRFAAWDGAPAGGLAGAGSFGSTSCTSAFVSGAGPARSGANNQAGELPTRGAHRGPAIGERELNPDPRAASRMTPARSGPLCPGSGPAARVRGGTCPRDLGGDFGDVEQPPEEEPGHELVPGDGVVPPRAQIVLLPR